MMTMLGGAAYIAVLCLILMFFRGAAIVTGRRS